jgi:hypothetical protein
MVVVMRVWVIYRTESCRIEPWACSPVYHLVPEPPPHILIRVGLYAPLALLVVQSNPMHVWSPPPPPAVSMPPPVTVQAHTCFFQVEMPRYTRAEIMRTQILGAIAESEGAGFTMA